MVKKYTANIHTDNLGSMINEVEYVEMRKQTAERTQYF